MMNTNALARNYDRLTPEERFRLILAAGVRKDEVEGDRLSHTAPRLVLSMPDHSPYGHALHELALLTFIELTEDAAIYRDALQMVADTEDAEEYEAIIAPKKACLKKHGDEHGKGTIAHRVLSIALVAGFVLRLKADGWTLFCKRLDIPPLSLWEGLPGLDRLQHDLDLTDNKAFSLEEFQRWLNTVRRPGSPESRVITTAEKVADDHESFFRNRVKWWNG